LEARSVDALLFGYSFVCWDGWVVGFRVGVRFAL
jgi:hypothetical protein